MYQCDCGKDFESREDIRDHIQVCEIIGSDLPECTICSRKSMVFLPYGNKRLCPTCAVIYDEKNTKLFHGALLLNHKGKKYEEILNTKALTLMNHFNMSDLPSIGIDVVLITFSQSLSPISHMMSDNGELIFILADVKGLKEREDFVFKHVIYHEIMHSVVTYHNMLGVTTNVSRIRSNVEAFVSSTVEDIQVTKYSINNDFKPYIRDEIRRDYGYYRNLAIPTQSLLNKLTDMQTFAGMLSLVYSYSSEMFFLELEMNSHNKKQIKKNLRYMKPHIKIFNSHPIIDIIKEIYEDKIAQSENEKREMYGKLLISCDNWLDESNNQIF